MTASSARGGWLRGVARLMVALVLAGILVLVVGYRFGPERFWFFALAQYLPYPVFVVPAAGALLLSFTLGWAWRLACVIGMWLVVTSVIGVEFNRGEAGPRHLRVMTYNVKDYLTIRRNGRLTDIAEEFRRHDPDIAVLQDARRLGDRADALRSIFGDRETFSFGQYVVASRFPLRDCGRREMPYRNEPHTYVGCTVTVNGIDVELITAHFISPREGLVATRNDPFVGVREWKQNVADRMVQAAIIADDIRPHRRATIVAGDLNAPDTSLVVRTLLDAGVRDSFATAGAGLGHTWGHSLRFRVSFVRIDHILVSPEFRVIDSFVGGAAGSPHRPVIADLNLSVQ